jgi:DNA-binding CsgD family transcriptional regulator
MHNSHKLSHRQLQCSELLVSGKTTKEIAESLNLSPRTVEAYLANIKQKMSCRNKTELIVKLMMIQVRAEFCTNNPANDV